MAASNIDELEKRVFEATVRLIGAAATVLPDDVEEALRRAYESEESELAKGMLSAILKNVEIAKTEGLPICQDTGTVIFYVKVGEKFPLLGRLASLLREATVEATKRVPLRPNAVHPITGKNTGDNTGRYIPWIEWEIVPGSDKAEITVLLKGGGSEAPSIAKVITPALGVKGLMKLVVDTIVDTGAKPCPPVLVGVGMAANADIAIKLAKKALLRPIGSRHEEKEVAELEEKLYRALNELGLGPHGVGGKTTVLDVHIDYAHRHPASFAVAVVVNCWAVRRSSMVVYPDGRIEFLTHKFLEKEVG